jgi:hypothetical protein
MAQTPKTLRRNRTIITELNIGDFTLLDSQSRYTCHVSGEFAVLGRLSNSQIRVGFRFTPLKASEVNQARRLLSLEQQTELLSRADRQFLNNLSAKRKSALLTIANYDNQCQTLRRRKNTPTPTSTPTKIATLAPTSTPLLPTPTSVPTTTPTLAPTVTPQASSTPTHHHVPSATPQTFPTGNTGITTLSLATGSAPHSSGSRDTFRTRVGWTHFAYDDPIVYPNQPGRSHLHLFFGNPNVNAYTVATNIRNNCRSAAAGGTANCSGYWIPALLNANNEVITPDFSLWYYKAGYQVSTTSSVVPPVGLVMIAGKMTGTPQNPQTNVRYSWNCTGNYLDNARYIPTYCAQGSVLSFSIEFPACWNGQDLDSSDHISHMAWGENGTCPASHPVQIPDISLNIEWRVPAGGTVGWHLSSDMYTISNSTPGGHSAHADWINGWDESIMQAFIDNCNNVEKDCGVDNLGDGRALSDSHIIPMYR